MGRTPRESATVIIECDFILHCHIYTQQLIPKSAEWKKNIEFLNQNRHIN